MSHKFSSYTFRNGISDSIPIGLGYLSVSFGFGVAAASGGLSPLIAIIISLTNMTSAGQLAGVGVILAAGSLIEMALTQLTINLRYSLMSISLSEAGRKLSLFPQSRLRLWHDGRDLRRRKLEKGKHRPEIYVWTHPFALSLLVAGNSFRRARGKPFARLAQKRAWYRHFRYVCRYRSA